MLTAIGFWVESLKDEARPAPQELIGTLPIDTRSALADYLATGLTYDTYRGYSWCRFNCGIEQSHMGKCALSDGRWLWPEGLAHYVREHNIVLPEEFVNHALSGIARRQPERTEDVNLSFWTQWCRPRRSADFLDGMRTARVAAEVRIAAMRTERIATLLKDKGLSDEPCIWNGCGQQALDGMRVCAEHSLQPIHLSLFEIHYFTGLQEYLRQLPSAVTSARSAK